MEGFRHKQATIRPPLLRASSGCKEGGLYRQKGAHGRASGTTNRKPAWPGLGSGSSGQESSGCRPGPQLCRATSHPLAAGSLQVADCETADVELTVSGISDGGFCGRRRLKGKTPNRVFQGLPRGLTGGSRRPRWSPARWEESKKSRGAAFRMTMVPRLSCSHLQRAEVLLHLPLGLPLNCALQTKPALREGDLAGRGPTENQR